MTEDNNYKPNKKIRGKAVARLGIYAKPFTALCASKPAHLSLTQWVNNLILEALDEN